MLMPLEFYTFFGFFRVFALAKEFLRCGFYHDRPFY